MSSQNLLPKAVRPPGAIFAPSLRKCRTWRVDPPPAPDPANPPPVIPKPDSAPKPEEKKSYTQAELDTMFADRAKQAANSATNELLKKLGVNTQAELETKVKEQNDAAEIKRKADEAAKSDLQKAQDAVVAAKKEADDAKAANAKIIQERQLEKRDNAIIAALTKARAATPEDVLYLMDRKFPDLVKATMKEDGTLEPKAIETLVTKAKAERKQDFMGSGPGIPSNSGGRNPDPDTGKQAAQTEAFRRARKDI